MWSLREFKAVAAVTLVAAGAMLVISPAVASAMSGKDHANCELLQPRLIVSRVLELDKLHASMQVALKRAEIKLRAIDLGQRNLDRWERTWRHADSASERSSHPVVRGINKMAALAKLPSQGLMVVHKVLSTAAKLVPEVFGVTRH